MDRRNFLKYSLASSTPFFLQEPAFANIGCQPTNPPPLQICRAGIDSNLAFISARQQYQNQWCWAACIEMIFAYYGYSMPQPAIVASTWGQVVNMPASDLQIMRDLNSSWTDAQGRNFQTVSQPVANGGAAQELAADHPLIVCTQGHAMVLTSLLFRTDPRTTAGEDIEAVVRDPWQNRGRRILSAQEWFSRNLLLAVRVL